MDRPPSKPFQLFAGHPALELINTLDMRFTPEPIELLTNYQDLLRFVAQLRLMPAEQARKLGRTVGEKEASRVLTSMVDLREALALVLYALLEGKKPALAQVGILEKNFHAAALRRKLQAGQPHLQWSWAGADREAETPLWMLAQSAADLLLSPDAGLVKECGDPTCRWLFLDVSKNHTRRWCDMKTCGNRMKARRHHARVQQAPL